MFSLCIATMDRYDTFLHLFLPKYINNPYIDEIIITDENGNDITKIQQNISSHKLKLYTNNKKLGPFLNKLKACSLAKNTWIALIDSDNYADEKYFLTALNYINNNQLSQNVILSPSWAKPTFNFTCLNNLIYKKGNFEQNKKIEKINNVASSQLMNVGNFIVNKFLIDNLIYDNNDVVKSSACDVIFFNVLLFEQLNLEFHVVENMWYDHATHNDSTYINTRNHFVDFNNNVNQRYNQLK